MNQSGHLGSLVWKAWVLRAPHTHSGQRRDLSKGRTKCAFIESYIEPKLKTFSFITKSKIHFFAKKPVCYFIVYWIEDCFRGCTFQSSTLSTHKHADVKFNLCDGFPNIYFVVTDTSTRTCTLVCSVPDPHSDP